MNEHRHASAPVPHYARATLATRIGLASVALACSSVVMGTGLGLFEMQARAGQSESPAVTYSAGTPGGLQAAKAPRAARRG